jgi:hypothetical protein
MGNDQRKRGAGYARHRTRLLIGEQTLDRQTVYPGSIPLDTDILSLQRNAMVALGYALAATIGTGTVADGLACTPTTPASMVVNVGQGSIIALETIDATTWGSLAADSNPLVKIGVNAEGATPFTLTAPGTSGQSINYLIEGAFLESDATPVTLPYYNASNPAQPYSGPGNSGTAQNTQRIQRAQLQLKAGTAANTGTQTTPAVDVGWVGLWVVTVNYGMTQITSAAIAEHPSAPFVPYKLPNMAPGFTREVTFNAPGAWSWTPSPGVVRARFHLQAPGGGGGGTSNANSAAGGGGGGGYGRVVETVTPGVAIGGVVGTGGTGGTGGSNGGAGSNTTCTTFGLTTFVGAGGAGTSTTSVGAGGIGGTTTGTFDFAATAPGGGAGQGYTGAFGGGQGGVPGDGRGGFNQLSIGAPGLPGAVAGQGGNGGSGTGSTGNAGGAGAGGYVRIEW